MRASSVITEVFLFTNKAPGGVSDSGSSFEEVISEKHFESTVLIVDNISCRKPF